MLLGYTRTTNLAALLARLLSHGATPNPRTNIFSPTWYLIVRMRLLKVVSLFRIQMMAMSVTNHSIRVPTIIDETQE